MTTWLRFRFLMSALTAAHLAATLLFLDAEQPIGAAVFGLFAVFGAAATFNIATMLRNRDQPKSTEIIEVEDAPESVEAYILVFIAMFVGANVDTFLAMMAFFVFYLSAVTLFFTRTSVIANPILFVLGWRFSFATFKDEAVKKRHLVISTPHHPLSAGLRALHRIDDGGVYFFNG